MPATQTQALTSTPTTLKDGSNEIVNTTNTWYQVQCLGNQSFYIQTATSAPSDSSSAFRIGPGQMTSVSRTGTDHVYVWQDDARGDGQFGTLVIERYTA